LYPLDIVVGASLIPMVTADDDNGDENKCFAEDVNVRKPKL
jgi:hypothetical protein